MDNKYKLCIDIIKKYFKIDISDCYDEFTMISFQAWSDIDTWDTSAYECINNEKEIEILKEILCNESEND